jgi:hypothetical protein
VLCSLVGKGGMKHHIDFQRMKDFFLVKISSEMQLHCHMGQTNERNESGEGGRVREFQFSPQSLQSLASPHRRHRSPAAPTTKPDQGQSKSTKFNDQKECFCFYFMFCNALSNYFFTFWKKDTVPM